MATNSDISDRKGAIAVYCGSSIGTQKAYSNAARSVGDALAQANRPLVYGGGSYGLMGIVSGTTLMAGGEAIGIVPYAMHVGGGEGENTRGSSSVLGISGHAEHEKMKTVVVESMHERKVEMAKRSVGFIGLPGGFGTFEEILEVTTWTQLGIHNKPVVVLNALGFFEPLRQLIQNGVTGGFINEANARFVIFVDGPTSHDEHETYDWGNAGVNAVEAWQAHIVKPLFDWTKRMDGTTSEKECALNAT